MDATETAECPVCLASMRLEQRSDGAWLVCPNGCPTEFEAPVRKPAASETERDAAALKAHSAGS